MEPHGLMDLGGGAGWLGTLIIGGLAVLLLLQRMPLPMRLLVGLMDVFAGLTLLVVVRQKFSGK